ncbi:MAG: type I methionyl aminopeptidase [Spirochaetales bacterium]|nr:type I methionyl aminopeptidase [Spirochaetales bacterium]
MIKLKSLDEIARIRESGILLAKTLVKIRDLIAPGITTKELDEVAYEYIRSHGGKPAFLGYFDYPASLCISINDEVIHGIPSHRKLEEGDIVGIDLGVDLKGFYSDACFTAGVGAISNDRRRLCEVTKECLYRAIGEARPGNRLHAISRAVYDHAREYGYDVVRKFCGHGVGFELHEDPQVFNYINSGPNPRLKPGMVLAIEPMVNAGTYDINILEDGWTVVTADGKDSAHFEHTIAIHSDYTEILTDGFI